ALAGACVGVGPLTTDRQPAAVADAFVAADLDLAPDVGLHLAAQVAFDAVVGLDPVAELDQVVVAQVTHPQVRADAGLRERLLGAGAAEAEDVGEGDLQPLVTRQVDADEACHPGQCSLFITEVVRVTAPTFGRAPASAPGVVVRGASRAWRAP